MTLREYARHRKARELSGGSLGAVQKAIKTGRIADSLGDDGRLDPELADKLWDQNTKASAPAPTRSGRPDPSSNGAAARYLEIRNRLTLANAIQKELDLAERRRELLPARQVEARYMGFVKRVNTALDSVRGRWRQRIVGLEDGESAAAALEQLIQEIKEDIADDGAASAD